MLHIAILDDEPEYIQLIRGITEEAMGRLGYSYELNAYTDVEKFLLNLREKDYYDIYLLDVEMPQMSGLEVARRIRKEFREPSIIYITNHVQYAIEAFEVNAFRYIPKRYLQEKLPEAYAVLGELHQAQNERVFSIKTEYRMEMIPFREIYYLQKDGKYIRISHVRGESRIRMTLAEAHGMLDSSQFWMVDRSYVVNKHQIVALKQQQLNMRNGSVVPVSKPRLNEIRQKFMEERR